MRSEIVPNLGPEGPFHQELVKALCDELGPDRTREVVNRELARELRSISPEQDADGSLRIQMSIKLLESVGLNLVFDQEEKQGLNASVRGDY